MYNGRLFFSSSNNDVAGSKPLHHLGTSPIAVMERIIFYVDMQLYSLLEDRRLSDAMRASIQQLDAKSWKLPQEDLLLAASSFCGTHSAVSVMGSNKRHPIRKRIQEVCFLFCVLQMTYLSPLQANLTLENTPFMIELGPRGEQNNDNEFHGLDIVYLLNPLSKAGQRSVGLMRLFENQLLLKQTAMLIPQTDLSDFPLQNYYRYVLPYHGSLARNDSVAVFEHLPTRHTFTIRTDVPEPWNVQSYKAHQDIDNLRCEGSYTCGDPIENDAGTTVCEVNEEEDGAATQCHTTPTYSDVTKATYLLKSIVLPGQCFEVLVEPYTGSEYHKPPSGLQIILRNELSGPDAIAKSTLVQSDTLVMNNYGYFQLQGNPGLWTLSLAPGRAASLYKIDPTMVFAHGDTLSVAVKSFRDSVTLVFVRKREGLEDIDLLDDAAAIYDVDPSASSPRRKLPSSSDNAGRNALWKSISTLWSKSQGDAKYFSGRSLDALKAGTAVDDAVAVANQTPEEEPEQLHVFSLATGKMYERLLRIMMLSVTKRTSMPVKFWLFENYLSPNFKKSAEIMSKKYGFEIGYVTYKWPAWLTQQSEKQRIIWGYKILFLDVLFPLSVKRIIYVDADQVVRADLKELWEMDLNGKPYGYVPFCSSRNETLGYQFWRSGFWSTHLQGLPYHISALYVVDLQNFRKRAVGDILRVTYDG